MEKNRSCPICESKKWVISREVFELREFQGGGLVVGKGAIMPVVPITCIVCGYIVYINPLIAELDIKMDNINQTLSPNKN